ncbi:MAG: carboxymuconolactone decarboxylase family protein [Actinomycetota bacterium]
MPRLSQVSKADAHPRAQQLYTYLFGERDPVAEPGTTTGAPGNWWTVMAQLPEMFDHMVDGIAFYRSPDRKLDPFLRELGQIRVGYAQASQFVFSQHCKACREMGMSEEKIQAIPNWSVATCFSDAERAVLAYTDALVLEGGRVSDGVFAAVAEHLDEVEILEFTYITLTYDLHARMTKALKLEFDDVEERIVEIPGGLLDPRAARAQAAAEAQAAASAD